MSSSARIYDQGYRRYDGPRLGRRAAVFSVWRHTVQRVLGLRRSARHKVLPVLAIVIAYLPAIAFIGILALIPEEVNDGRGPASIVPSYADYYGFVNAAILLFVVFAAPEALCPDRRHRSLSLYLASPLTRDTYLVAKALAVASVVLLVTLGPLLLLLIGYVLQGNGPDGPLGVLSTLGHIVAAGVAVAVFYTAFALALASLTDRKGLATGGALITLFATHTVAGTLAFTLDQDQRLLNLSLFIAPFELGARLLTQDAAQLAMTDVSTVTVTAGCIAWVALFSLVLYLRYASLRVTR